MNDIRTQLPECPLEYEVPFIPGNHTALVIPINAADIDWQEKMLPWTLASLINNTDLVMKGVHLYITCEDSTEDRIQTALKNFDLPQYDTTMIKEIAAPFITFGEHGFGYDSICMWDVNYWAFRGDKNQIKLPLGHVLQHNWGWGVADYSLHSANTIETKASWMPLEHLKRSGIDTPTTQVQLTQYFMDAGKRARWLHDANRAVYGEGYDKKQDPPNVASYLFNGNGEPNWHIDTSILQYHAAGLVGEASEWFIKWKHLGMDALTALYLIKTGQHAYNFCDSLMIEGNTWEQFTPKNPYLPPYPRLCNMQHGTPKGYSHAIKQLMGAQLAMKI
ncbi:MAG: hypothetical protein OXH00_25935 [Candidatus Poribacteria bacterium]|nr:hypothetical protein [Candidatus Poribacteria bacterium]